MTEQTLGTTTITQVGIIVQDIEAKVRAWAEVLGLPMPEIMITDTYEHAQTEYKGKPSAARAKLAFFHLGQVEFPITFQRRQSRRMGKQARLDCNAIKLGENCRRNSYFNNYKTRSGS